MWSKLNHHLGSNWRLFIEPPITVLADGRKKTLRPDIVVGDTRQIIAVIELKYLPRTRPRYEKDIRSLGLIADNKRLAKIRHDRFRGPQTAAVEYSASASTLFVWAGVHVAGGCEGRLFSDGYDSIAGRYLQIHAATHADRPPELYYYEALSQGRRST